MHHQNYSCGHLTMKNILLSNDLHVKLDDVALRPADKRAMEKDFIDLGNILFQMMGMPDDIKQIPADVAHLMNLFHESKSEYVLFIY